MLAGTLALSLQPRALEYIAARLGMLGELEALKQRSPVDYFRGCANNVRDFKRLEKLQHVLQRVRRLRIASVACKLRRGAFLEAWLRRHAAYLHAAHQPLHNPQ